VIDTSEFCTSPILVLSVIDRYVHGILLVLCGARLSVLGGTLSKCRAR